MASIEPWRQEKTHEYLTTAGGRFGGSVVQLLVEQWCSGAVVHDLTALSCVIWQSLLAPREMEIVGVPGQLSNAFSAEYLRSGQLNGNVEQQLAHGGQFLRLPVRLWLRHICNKRMCEL